MKPLSLLVFTFLISIGNVHAGPIEIASLSCVPDKNIAELKYLPENDDFFSKPKLPLQCRIGNAKFKATGARGAFSQSGRCGAQPPVSIQLSRNDVPLIADAIFGDNCFGGPSISKVQIEEEQVKLKSLTLCVTTAAQTEPVCKTLQMQGNTKPFPINQNTLGQFAAERSH